jgi:hypothetical protein
MMRRILLLLVALIIGFLLCYFYQVVTFTPYRHTVTVGVTGGVAPFAVIPDPVTARRGDTLRWVHPTADSLIIDFSREQRGAPTVDLRPIGVGGAAAVSTIRRYRRLQVLGDRDPGRAGRLDGPAGDRGRGGRTRRRVVPDQCSFEGLGEYRCQKFGRNS